MPSDLQEPGVLDFAERIPDVGQFASKFVQTVSDTEQYRHQQRRNFRTRYCVWDGKGEDGRKHYRNQDHNTVIPWEGSSDVEDHLVDDLIYTDLALCLNALQRATPRAFPIEGNDTKRAAQVSTFVKWLIHAGMRDFDSIAEYAVNDLLQTGIMATGQFYERREQKIPRMVTVEEVALLAAAGNEELAVQLTGVIEQGLIDEQIVDTLSQVLEVTTKRARGILTELKETGTSSVPVRVIIHDAPVIKSYTVGYDLLFPYSTTFDIQKAPIVFVIEEHTPEALREKVRSQNWRSDWVEYAINHLKGETILGRDREQIQRGGGTLMKTVTTGQSGNKYQVGRAVDKDGKTSDVVQVARAFRKVIDEHDGISLIEETVFHPSLTDQIPQVARPYAKHGVFNAAHGMYPFKLTPLERADKNLYSSRSYCEIAKDAQDVLKTSTDIQIDASALRGLPPIMHRHGHSPTQWGPLARVGYRRPGEIHYGDIPNFHGGDLQITQQIRNRTKAHFGHMVEDGASESDAANKKQRLVNKVLEHFRGSIDQLFSLYQQFGPTEKWIKVTGVADPVMFEKGDPTERFDFYLDFDVALSQSESLDKIIDSLGKVFQLDPEGMTADRSQAVQVILELLIPSMADRIIRPEEQGREQAIQEELTALAQIYAGEDIEVKPEDAHQTKMQVLMNVLRGTELQQQIKAQTGMDPPFLARYNSDPQFKAVVDKRIQQRQFQLQQRQNAQTGRFGTQTGNLGPA